MTSAGRPRIVVVGLGPGDPGLVSAATLAEIDRVPVQFLRTERHPSAHLVRGASAFDHHYDAGDTFDHVYEAICSDLLAAAEDHGEVLYAVPGSPRVLERTVDLLDRAAAEGGVEVVVHGAMSFVDLAWIRLGVDPFESGVRLVDAHRFAVAAAGERGPLLVAHCHNQRVLSDVKLAVETPPPEGVVVLQRLGLPDESITTVLWQDLDRSVDADHLTTLYVPEMATPVAGEFQRFVELVATLRNGCPWDAEQTHTSLTRHLLEETYEVLEALAAVGDGGPDTDLAAYGHLEEELGDLLFQIVFHATLATEAGAFDMADVARGIHDKLVGRHPHVFGQVEVSGPDDVVANWEEIKKAEKGRTSIFDGIPVQLPALLYVAKVHKKARSVGVDLPGDPESAGEVLQRAVVAATETPTPEAVGDLLVAAVGLARTLDIDPEASARAAANRLTAAGRRLEPDGLAAGDDG